MKFEQGDVIVQRLAVVVVVDVGGGHPQSLGPRAPVLLSQIMVTNTNIDGVTSPDDAENGEIICTVCPVAKGRRNDAVNRGVLVL